MAAVVVHTLTICRESCLSFVCYEHLLVYTRYVTRLANIICWYRLVVVLINWGYMVLKSPVTLFYSKRACYSPFWGPVWILFHINFGSCCPGSWDDSPCPAWTRCIKGTTCQYTCNRTVLFSAHNIVVRIIVKLVSITQQLEAEIDV